jgi:uncharacterized protein
MPDKQTASKTGYSQEDDYFKKQELEWINKRRAELDAERAKASRSTADHPHWMRCPKCGSGMDEVSMESVKVDRCTSCGGIYFDKGELELVTRSQQPAGLFRKLFG